MWNDKTQNFIQIHDKLFTEPEMEHIFNWCMGMPLFFSQRTLEIELVQKQIRFSNSFDPNNHYLYEKINEKVLSSVGLNLNLFHCYLNFYDFSTPTIIHSDYNFVNTGVTAIFFSTKRWDLNWGGELLFYDDDYEVTQAVSYKPNRLVIFDSSVLHGVKQPSVNAMLPRYSVAFKYDVIKDDQL